MTPREQADDIYSKMCDTILDNVEDIEGLHEASKACAIIHVNGILDAFEQDDKAFEDCHYINSPIYRYFEQVKSEIEKL